MCDINVIDAMLIKLYVTHVDWLSKRMLSTLEQNGPIEITRKTDLELVNQLLTLWLIKDSTQLLMSKT